MVIPVMLASAKHQTESIEAGSVDTKVVYHSSQTHSNGGGFRLGHDHGTRLGRPGLPRCHNSSLQNAAMFSI